MNGVSMTKFENSSVLCYSFLMTEDDVPRFIKAWIILKNDPSKAVVITKNNNGLNYANYITD